MANIIDYIIWRGDLSFESDKINELDELIFSRISYLPFEHIDLKESNSIYDLAQKMVNVDKSKFLWDDDIKLIDLLANSNRFKNIEISDIAVQTDYEEEKQFAGCTINLPNNVKYISFRGTDWTLLGWKEDFNISFSYNIPSQVEAVNYLNGIAKKYSNSKFIVGGHSKGGNIAVYASIFCEDGINERILKIINIDGPGFPKVIVKNKKYLEIKNKVKTFIPQSSIIGRVLEYKDDYYIIESTQKGILQHDIYTWNVGPTFLIQMTELTDESKFANAIITEWFETTTINQREKFINIIYDILVNSDVTSIASLSKSLLKNSNKLIDNYKNATQEEKKEIEEMVKQIIEIAKNTLKKEVTTKSSNIDIKNKIKMPKRK